MKRQMLFFAILTCLLPISGLLHASMWDRVKQAISPAGSSIEGQESVQEPAKEHFVYSHGFGDSPRGGMKLAEQFFEPDSYYAPYFENDLSQASFYSQDAQKRLLKTFSNRVKDDENASITFMGFSMGGGTGVNLLDKIIHYDQNKTFFEGTDVKSAADAQKILDALNRGKGVFTQPALSLKDTRVVLNSSSLLSAATFAGLTAGAYYLWNSYFKKKNEQSNALKEEDKTIADGKKAEDRTPAEVAEQEKRDKEEQEKKLAVQKRNRMIDILAKIGILGMGGAAYYLFGNVASNTYASGLVNKILPLVTNFDASDTEPMQALKSIIASGKYTSPTLWHFNKTDEILYSPEEKIRKAFEQASPNHEIIFTDDSGHNDSSRQFLQKLYDFSTKK